MARRRTPLTDDGAEHRACIEWYRDRLTAPAPPAAQHDWPPVFVGPTWQRTPDGFWLLPEHTIGWDVLAWCGLNLQHAPGRPWRFTDEQARWLLWWHEVDDHARFVSRDGILQRLKGWGKDPVGACLCANEGFGLCRPTGEWIDDQPEATDCPDAWVQTAAVSLEQTKNTMRLFPGLFTAEARRRYGLQIGKELVHGLGDRRLIQAVTSSPATLEWARATFVLKNETHHWNASNEGHEMAAVIDRNATKSPDGGARTLGITNAFEPSEDSVAQHDREAYELARAGGSLTTGILYDSLEAPPEAPLSAEFAAAVVSAIRGDSTWLDVKRIVASILDTRNPTSRSRRYWYNQIVATEDAWVAPQEWDACADVAYLPGDRAIVTLGFDGSKSDDHTALIGCDVAADHLFEIGIWAPEKATGLINRAEVRRAVAQAFADFDVVGFYGDVEHWESDIDQWAEDHGAQLCVKASSRQPVAWDIRAHGEMFTRAVERTQAAIISSAAEAQAAKAAGREPGPRMTHCGSHLFRIHVHNARRAPNKWGVSVRKEHRESARKIDAVPAAVLARLARLDYLALPESRRRKAKRSGVVW